jgi:Na+-transporting NADH:ubiquinone oxidoreductase subunit NqrC
MSFKRIIIIIVVIQLFSVISITGFYYMMSPLQNCLRMGDGEDGNGRKFCIENTSW